MNDDCKNGILQFLKIGTEGTPTVRQFFGAKPTGTAKPKGDSPANGFSFGAKPTGTAKPKGDSPALWGNEREQVTDAVIAKISRPIQR
jgi:hypothetical protein